MQSFPSTDLKQTLGDVLAAAAQSPVAITRHSKPRFVLMTIEEYERRAAHDPRTSHATAEAPQEHLDMLLADIDRQLDELGRG
jgi:prevent-host-death family protein